MNKKSPGIVEYYTRGDYPKITPSDKLTYARELIREGGYRVLPVFSTRSSNRFEGLLYRVGILLNTSTKSEMLVRDVMAPPIVTLTPSESVITAVKRMLESDEWYAPVLDREGNFLGMFGLESILEYYYWNSTEPLQKHTCNEVMGGRDKLVYVTPEETVTRLWYLMMEHKYAGIPVIKNGKVVGIVTQHDLLAHGIGRPELESESNPRKTKVKELMKTPVYTVGVEDPILSAVRLLVEKNIGRVVVVREKDRPAGIIDREDLVRFLLKNYPV